METKKCSKCGEIKPVGEFSKRKDSKDGLRGRCKECELAYHREYSESHKKEMCCYQTEYYKNNRDRRLEEAKIRSRDPERKKKRKIYNQKYSIDNKDKLLEQKKEYYIANKGKILEYNHSYYKTNREDILAYKRVYWEDNKIYVSSIIKKSRDKKKEKYSQDAKIYYQLSKQKISQRQKARYNSDTYFRLSSSLRARVQQSVRANSNTQKTKELLGCSIVYLKQYLEQHFIENMSWDNYGYYGWHIDHIKPCASFDLTNPEEQKQCFHYTNLQPLWAYDNLSKGAKYEEAV